MKENLNVTVTLPEELIEEILLKLPVSSLIRFKCVCKLWRSLICNSQFAQSHFDLAVCPSDHRLNTERIFGGFIESNDLSYKSIVSLRRLPPPPSNPYRSTQFWGSCRGFVLLSYGDDKIVDLIVWNPSTGEHKRAPASQFGSTLPLFGFGYDASTDDYLVIVITTVTSLWRKAIEDFMFFSVKTNSWNHLEEGKEIFKEYILYLEAAGLLLNGAIHWVICSFDYEDYRILAFDLVQRCLLEIPLPIDFTDTPAYDYELHTIEGRLSVLCFFRGKSQIELWMMKEYKVMSSWTMLLVSVTLPPTLPRFCINTDDELFISNFSPLRSEEFIGKLLGSNFCVLKVEFVLDIECEGKMFGRTFGRTYCHQGKVDLMGLCEHLANGGGLVLYSRFLQHSMYRESLLSLLSDNQHQ